MQDIDAHTGRILRFLRQREIQGDVAPITLNAIALALQLDPVTVSMAVALLEVRRCVLRGAPPGTSVRLTDLGRFVASQAP
jgi:hypothetical protein